MATDPTTDPAKAEAFKRPVDMTQEEIRAKWQNDPNWPVQSFDAMDWARAFIATFGAKLNWQLDESTMLAWFASALMRGYDQRQWQLDAEKDDPTPAVAADEREAWGLWVADKEFIDEMDDIRYRVISWEGWEARAARAALASPGNAGKQLSAAQSGMTEDERDLAIKTLNLIEGLLCPPHSNYAVYKSREFAIGLRRKLSRLTSKEG